jgi:heterodisulfide reductase subunit A-like polyferredoxin
MTYFTCRIGFDRRKRERSLIGVQHKFIHNSTKTGMQTVWKGLFMNFISVCGWKIPHFTTSAAVVGTGAAGYNAADTLYSLGVTDVLVITEGRMMGTSRNTGSDKQTYYKLNLSGGVKDSVYDMAKALMRGGYMHGDIALTDVALSAR